ncbi:methylenetetrahydrofolate reductase [Paracoccus sp. p4-l81]|uniref:methylenetetrahydrofolate reductase n=1 Tax=Paracoccus sp. p4-l81 TaxID=3342806 RepID=UPI0035B980C7
MALIGFRRSKTTPDTAPVADFLEGFSIEVMPRTAAGIADFRDLLPVGSRVYVAHISGTPIENMVATVARLSREGMAPMPHLPARLIPDRATLADWLARYREAGATQALVLGGGLSEPTGSFHEAMQLLETGLFDGFTRIHVAGHPEGNRDIDPAGGEAQVMAALARKQDFARATGIDMAIVTQFAFEAQPIIDWTARLAQAGITLPVHIGIAGPAKLQTMIKFAIACGVGPSLRVLQRRARDVTKLVMPFEPDSLIAELAAHKAADPDFPIERVHFFPLGGIKTSAEWISRARAR